MSEPFGRLPTDRPVGEVRAAFLMPGLLVGGLERVMASIAERTCDRVHWTGCALVDRAKISPMMVRRVTAVMPVFAGAEPAIGDTLSMQEVTNRQAVSTLDGEPEFHLLKDEHEAIQRAAADADVIVAFGIPELKRYTQGFRGRVVLTSHGMCNWTAKLLAGSRDGATHFTAVSGPAADAYPADLRREVTLLHNGVSIEHLPPQVPRTRKRQQWGLAADDIVIGYLGRFSQEKHPTAPALAAAKLGGRFKAVCIGPGCGDGEGLAKLKGIAGERVRGLGPTESVGDVLNAMDVLIQGSWAEGFGMSLVEAWICGVPTVSTHVGVIPEMEQRYGQVSVIIPRDANARQLARAVKAAIHRRNLPTVARAHRAAWQNLTAPTMAARWADYLHTIVA